MPKAIFTPACIALPTFCRLTAVCAAGLALLGPYLRPYRGRVALALLSLLVAAGTVLAFCACLRADSNLDMHSAHPAEECAEQAGVPPQT